MSIEILATKAINLPVDNISKQSANQINQDNINFLNNLPPRENQILSYKPEQFHNQGNSISAQIVESIARLDSTIQNMGKKNESSTNLTKSYKQIQTESTHKTNSHSYIDHPLNRGRDWYMNSSREYYYKQLQILRTVRKTTHAVRLVQSLSTAFSKTLNKFLKM